MRLEAAKRGLPAPISVLAIGPALLLLVGSDASVHPTINRLAPESSTIGQTPQRDVVRRWRELDGCAPVAAETSTGVTTVTTWSCRADSTVQMVLVNGAGHTWPGAVIFKPPGSAAASVDASRLIADFFASHPAART